jgi:hypothetical protein
MRKLLAIALMGGALIVSASAAFAQDNTGVDQSTVEQNVQPAPFPLPLLPLKPLVSITIGL